MGAGAVGIKVELAFLDAVLHVAAGAIEVLVEGPGAPGVSLERGDHEARIGLALRPFRLGHHPAAPAPAVERRPAEVLEPARRFKDFPWATRDSWSRRRRVIAKAESTHGAANPRFIVTSLAPEQAKARRLYEKVYCARGEMENRLKECQGDLFADRTSSATMRANQLRLWFASMAYVLICALRRIGLKHTRFATATCGTIRLVLLKIGALVTISHRRVKFAMASACPFKAEFARAHALLSAATR